MRALLLAAALTLVPAHAIAQSTQTPAVLAQQRVDAALRVLNAAILHYQQGSTTVDDVGAWGSRWYHARKDAGLTGAALIVAAQEWVDKMRAFEQLVKSRVQAGLANTMDADKAAYHRLDAELVLAKLKTP